MLLGSKLTQNCKGKMKTISKFVTWIKVKIGLALCSGYGVYPNGFKSPGCDDCYKD